MRRRLRFSDVSFPVVLAAVLWACGTRRWAVAIALVGGVGAIGLFGALTRRGGRPGEGTTAPTERPLLVYLYSPL